MQGILSCCSVTTLKPCIEDGKDSNWEEPGHPSDYLEQSLHLSNTLDCDVSKQ